MHAFNLRFGPATTPKQRPAYHRFFEILDQARDDILAEATLDTQATARANPRHASDYFENMERVIPGWGRFPQR